jgi:hypothetical protein
VTVVGLSMLWWVPGTSRGDTFTLNFVSSFRPLMIIDVAPVYLAGRPYTWNPITKTGGQALKLFVISYR